MSTTRTITALASGLMLLAVSACTEPGGEEPTPTARPTEVTSTSEPSDGGRDDATTTPDRPDVPPPDPDDYAGKDEQTGEGAEQALRYWFALAIWGHQTGDSSELRSLSTDDCPGCTEIASDIDDIAESETFWSVSEMEDYKLEHEQIDDETTDVSYGTLLGQHDEGVRGNERTRTVGDKASATFGTLRWAGDGWVVAEVGIDSKLIEDDQ
jgi:hypothetical protein